MDFLVIQFYSTVKQKNLKNKEFYKDISINK
ncbi:Uncharacterised protein [Veillonella rodentium]|uniref:Uncharacterized protein n=1 Tax=Veillonella rodentium TaxID=248315 RepID=A0A239Y8K7_9FIRM|nr:Uncharacterised protein [Veillonella rodentium]